MLNDWCVQEFSNFRISYQFLTVLPTCFEGVYMYGGHDQSWAWGRATRNCGEWGKLGEIWKA